MTENTNATQEADTTAHKKKDVLTRAMRCEIAKPLDLSWEEAGSRLHLLRSVMHRVLNAVIFELVVALRDKRKPDTRGMIARELDNIRQHAKADAYKNLELPSAITDAIEQRGRQMGMRYLKKQQTEGFPAARPGSPIFVRNRESSWELRENDQGGVELGVRLTAGRTGKTWFALRANHGTQWSRLRQLARSEDPTVTLGDLKIVRDERHKKWMVLITYSEPRPKPIAGTHTMVVHRGVYNFLYYACSDGHAGTLMHGGKLLATRKALEARRREMKRGNYERGTGALGRGRKRRFEGYESVGDKIARCCKTTCQQAAAKMVFVAKQRGAFQVFREDYGGIKPDEDRAKRRFIERFPFHQLGECCDWAAEKAGLQLGKVPSEHISTTCPRCGDCDTRFANHRTQTFHCGSCDYTRPLDFVAAIHMLRRSGADMSIWDARFAAELRIVKMGQAAE